MASPARLGGKLAQNGDKVRSHSMCLDIIELTKTMFIFD
jgi:hypothetical protein